MGVSEMDMKRERDMTKHTYLEKFSRSGKLLDDWHMALRVW
jgi:hypothetical protein